MTSDESDERSYLCGACNRVRSRDDVEMVSDSESQYGSYPLCADNSDCTIARVARQRDGGSRFKVDEPLE